MRKQPKIVVNRHVTGQTGEFLVAAELCRRGFTVALPTGNAVAFDMLADSGGKRISVQVKSSTGQSIQLSLKKFLKIEMDGNRQIIYDKDGIDSSIHIFCVFIGKEVGRDRFYCCSMGEWIDLIRRSHKKYLGPKEERPGENKSCLHAAHKENDMIESDAFLSIDDWFARVQQA